MNQRNIYRASMTLWGIGVGIAGLGLAGTAVGMFAKKTAVISVVIGSAGCLFTQVGFGVAKECYKQMAGK